MKWYYLSVLLPAITYGMKEKTDYRLLDATISSTTSYFDAQTKFGKLYLKRKEEIDYDLANPSTKNFKNQIDLAICQGKLNLAIILFNKYEWMGDVNAAHRYNPIEACLIALRNAQPDYSGDSYLHAYRKAESAMLMAFILDFIPDLTCITKSQIHRAWQFNKTVSRMMAFCRRYPENAENIVEEHKQMIRAEFTKKLTQ